MADDVPSTVSCPTCSADHRYIHKQSLAKKAAKVGAFGIFAAGSVAKTFKCSKCGYTW